MTVLMFACKAGASGVGDPKAAARVRLHTQYTLLCCNVKDPSKCYVFQVVKKLLADGASLDSRCKWTDMTALHYATYFDVGPVVTTLLTATKVL